MRRIDAGYWIVLDPHGEIVENIICGLSERARARAEEVLHMTWDNLVLHGYKLEETDIWTLR